MQNIVYSWKITFNCISNTLKHIYKLLNSRSVLSVPIILQSWSDTNARWSTNPDILWVTKMVTPFPSFFQLYHFQKSELHRLASNPKRKTLGQSWSVFPIHSLSICHGRSMARLRKTILINRAYYGNWKICHFKVSSGTCVWNLLIWPMMVRSSNRGRKIMRGWRRKRLRRSGRILKWWITAAETETDSPISHFSSRRTGELERQPGSATYAKNSLNPLPTTMTI